MDRGLYNIDRKWADACTSQIAEILRPWMSYLAEIVVAPAEQDNKQATDYCITFKDGTIAARVRRPDCKYRDFTIRSRRSNGHETELSKLKKGFASRYFYSWTDDDFTIIAWMLLDMDKVRNAGLLDRTWPEKENRDRKTKKPDGTYFISIPVRVLQSEGCMIAHHKIRVPALPEITPIIYDSKPASRARKSIDMSEYTTLWNEALV